MNINNKPKVSVCIPTYGRAGVLSKVIGSVLAQTFRDFEVFISDDASPDNTGEIVKKFSDTRIRYHRNEINLGVRDNWNFIVKNAKGEYIFKLDDDDYIHPLFLEKTISLLEKYHNIGSVYTGFYYASNYDGEWIEEVVDNAFPNTEYIDGIDYVRGYLLNADIPRFHPSSAVFRYSTARDAGFFDKAVNDLMFSLTLAAKADVGYIPEPLFYYVQHRRERASYNTGNPGLINFEPTRLIEDFFRIDFVSDNDELMKIKDVALRKARITRSIMHVFMCKKGLSLRSYMTAVASLIERDKKLLTSPIFLAGLLAISVIPQKLAEKLSYMYKSKQIFTSLAKTIFRTKGKHPHGLRT